MSSPFPATIFVGNGFLVEDLFLATGGILRSRPVYDVGVAAPPGAAQDVLGARFGIDLKFPGGDLSVDGNGDLDLTMGTDGFRAAFSRALITEPGEIFWRPNYGIGVLRLLNQRLSASLIAEIKRRIEQYANDQPEIIELERNDVGVGPSGDVVDVAIQIRLNTGREDIGVRIRRAA